MNYLIAILTILGIAYTAVHVADTFKPGTSDAIYSHVTTVVR